MNRKSIFSFLKKVYHNQKLLLLCIFLLSLSASLAFLLFFVKVGPFEHLVPGPDYFQDYKPMAERIIQGKHFLAEGADQVEIPPGYPIILVPFLSLANWLGVGEVGLVVIFNTIIAAVSACFLFLIGQSLFDKKIGLIASLLWLSYPFNLWFVKNPHTELPFILLLFIGIWLYILALRKRSFGFIFLSGIIFGLAVLIRPMGIFIPFILALMVFFLLKEYSLFRVRSLIAGILLLGFLFAILPWEMYLFSETGQFIPIVNGKVANVVSGLAYALEYGDESSPWPAVPSDVLALMNRIEAKNLNNGLSVLSFLKKELVREPASVLKLIGLKMARAWYATSHMWWEKKILMVQIFYLLTALIGIIYGIRVYKKKIRSVIFLLVLIFCFWGQITLTLSILRYMMPAMGLVFIFSAISISFLLTQFIKNFSIAKNKIYE